MNKFTFLNVRVRYFFPESYHIFSHLFDVNHVFSIFSSRVDDFSTSCDLQWLILMYILYVFTCSENNYLSPSKFHKLGKDNPVSDSLIPHKVFIYFTKFTFYSDVFFIYSAYALIPYFFIKIISLSSNAYDFSLCLGLSSTGILY